jgi:hypothetical protein
MQRKEEEKLELTRADLWEIHFALNRYASYYENLIEPVTPENVEIFAIREIRLSAIQSANQKVWNKITEELS